MKIKVNHFYKLRTFDVIFIIIQSYDQPSLSFDFYYFTFTIFIRTIGWEDML